MVINGSILVRAGRKGTAANVGVYSGWKMGPSLDIPRSQWAAEDGMALIMTWWATRRTKKRRMRGLIGKIHYEPREDGETDPEGRDNCQGMDKNCVRLGQNMAYQTVCEY